MSLPIFDRATNLLDALQAYGIGRRPLVLVGHSLGGLVIKQMIRHSATADDQFSGFVDQLSGVVFFATPHTGSGLATVADALARCVTGDLVAELRAHLPSLRELDGWYRNYATRTGLPNLVYAEGRPLKFGIQIVSDTSSDPHLPHTSAVKLDEDHVSICKIPHPAHRVYLRVRDFVTEHTTASDTGGAGPPGSPGPDRPEPAGPISARALRLLEPQRLPAVERDYLRTVHDHLTQRSVTLAIGAAGSGKSVAMGQVARQLLDAGRSVVVIPCSLADGARAAPTYGYFVARLAEAAGLSVSTDGALPDVGHGTAVLIDTIDMILSPTSRPHLDKLLGTFEQAGAVVLMTCRPQEFHEYLEPSGARLPSLLSDPSIIKIPPLSEPEIVRLATAYLDRLGRRPSNGYEAFCQSLLGLASSRRSMLEIVQSPLMLGMVCDLYGSGGVVPADLDVGRLYRAYWQEKVSRARSGEIGVVEAKQRVCRRMAALLWQRSQEAIQEWCAWNELKASDTDQTGLEDLISEGVLAVSPLLENAIRFIHQTFCEYAMAVHLADPQSDRELTDALNGVQHRSGDTLHWWPVLREALAIRASHGRLGVLVNNLPVEDLAVFRGVAFAAARGDRQVLAGLVASSVEDAGSRFSRERREVLLEILSAVDATYAAPAIQMLDSLIEWAPVDELPKVAIIAAQLTQTLGNPEERLGQALSSVRRLTGRVGARTDPPTDAPHEAIARYLAITTTDSAVATSPVFLTGVRELLPRWRRQAFREGVAVHAALGVAEHDRRALKEVMSFDHADDRPRESVVLAIQLARPWAPPNDKGTARDLLDFLLADGLTKRARHLRATAVGAEAANWPESLQLLGQTFRWGAPADSEACFVALRATCQHGGVDQVAELVGELLAAAGEHDATPGRQLQQLAGLIIDELADRCSGGIRTTLRDVLAACLDEHLDDRTVSALATLADDDLETWRRVIAAIPAVPSARRARTIKNVIGQIPTAVAAQVAAPMLALLAEHAPGDDFARARLLGKAASSDKAAREELLRLAKSSSERASKQAIHQLRDTDAARIWLQPNHLRPLLLDGSQLLIPALELLRDMFRDGDRGMRDIQTTNLLMRDVLCSLEPPPPELRRADGREAARILDVETRLLACCHGWLRAAPANDDGAEAASALALRVDAMCDQPSRDPSVQRAFLLLVMQAAWRNDQPGWQARASSWLVRLLERINPDSVDEGPRAVRDAIRRLLSSGITNQPQLIQDSTNWTPGGLRQLLAVVLERDPLGATSPAIKALLQRDQGGVLAAQIAHRRPLFPSDAA